EARLVDRLRGREPDQEHYHQAGPEHGDRAEGGRPEHFEGAPGRGIEARLAPSRQLVEAERRKRTDQGEAGRDGIDQRHDGAPDRKPQQDKADDRIDQAQEDRMAGHREEIVGALRQRVLEVRHADGADRGMMDVIGTGQGMEVSHGHFSQANRLSKETALGPDLFRPAHRDVLPSWRRQAARCAASPLASANMILDTSSGAEAADSSTATRSRAPSASQMKSMPSA